MAFDSRVWTDLHGDQGMDPEPVDDLRERHAAMARRMFTHAEPVLARPELAEVQARLDGWRGWLKKWRAWTEAPDVTPGMHEVNIRAYAMMRQHVREARQKRRAMAARLAARS